MQQIESIAPSPAAIRLAIKLGGEMAARDAEVRPDLSNASRYANYLRFRDAHREKWEHSDHFIETWQERLSDVADNEGRRLGLRQDDAMQAWETVYNDLMVPLRNLFWEEWERRQELPARFAQAGRLRPRAKPQTMTPRFEAVSNLEEARTQYALGVRYETGAGVARDCRQAAACYRKAAEHGCAKAQINLARLYFCGEGVAIDRERAFLWYRKAAEQGAAKAQYNLAVMYAAGKGVARDAGRAAYWYRQTARQGHVTARLKLGLAYAAGKGVAKDLQEAMRWFRQAAKQGNLKARHNLQVIRAHGDRIARNAGQAVLSCS